MTGRRLAWLAPAVATAAVYAPHLGHPFFYDAVVKLVGNAKLGDPLQYFAAFGEPGYSEDTTRLVPNLTFALDHALWGWEPFGFHLTQLLFHLANVLLVGWLGTTIMRRAGRSDSMAPLLGSAIFGLHPLVSEGVLYSNARPNVIATTFYVSAVVAWLRADVETAAHRARWRAVFALALVLALLSKGLAVTVVVMVPLAAVWVSNGDRPRGAGVRAALVLGGIGTVVVLATGAATGLVDALSVRGWGGLGAIVLEQSEVLLRYGTRALVPWPGLFDVDHSGLGRLHERLSVGPSLDALWLPLVSFAVVCGALSACIVWRRRAPVATFFALWWFLAHAPTSIVPRDEVMVEYRAYLPMVGLSLLFGRAIEWGLARWLARDDRALGRSALVAGVTLGTLLAVATTVRAGDWASAQRLWGASVDSPPVSARALTNLALALEDRGAVDEAEARLRAALDVDPTYVRAHNNLGNLLLQQGRIDEAIAAFRRGLEHGPEFAPLHSNLGRALMRQRSIDEAIGHHRKALELAPDAPAVLVNLAAAVSYAGRAHEAVELLERAAVLEPEAVVVQVDLAHALAGVGRTIEAIEHYERALALSPDQAAVHTSLGALLAEQGDADAALRHLQRAVALAPETADVHSNLAALLARQGRYAEAIEVYARALALEPDHRAALAGAAAARALAAPGTTTD